MIRRLVRRESEKSALETVQTKLLFVSCTSRLYLNQGPGLRRHTASVAATHGVASHHAACNTLSRYGCYSTLNSLGIAPRQILGPAAASRMVSADERTKVLGVDLLESCG